MQINTKLTISRPHSNQEGDNITIAVTDAKSGVEFLELQMGLADFATAITGHARMNCVGEFRGEHVGKKREVKSVKVPVTFGPWRLTEAEELVLATKLFEPYAVDGWEGNVHDLFNQHNRKREGDKEYAKVSFTRFVEGD